MTKGEFVYIRESCKPTIMEETMNEFEVQSLVMQARGVKPADKFVMICILKNVDWSTWRGSVRLLYISKKYDVNLRTLHRIIQRLKNLGWIKVNSKPSETIIDVDLKTLTLKKGSVKMTQCQNDNDKMTSSECQNDIVESDKMTLSECQNDTHINKNNNNTININKDDLEMVSKQEALAFTSSQDFNSLGHMCDHRGKVPLHVLNAQHRMREIERRWLKSDESKKDLDHYGLRVAREKFDKGEKLEDYQIYGSRKEIRKTWG